MNDPKQESRTGQKSGGGEEDVYDVDASEPEVLKKQSQNKLPEEKPSQAEGDRDTVEADLKQKRQ
jgi:hypothetical protein